MQLKLIKLSLTLLTVIICSACVGQILNEDFKTLNISALDTETKLVDRFKKKFGDRKLKHSIANSNDKVLKSLIAGSTDAYIGTLEIPPLYKEHLESYLIAKDALVVVTHPSNQINNLSHQDLVDIFSRKASNWNSFGLTHKPIVVIDRSPQNIERQTLYKELFGIGTLPISSKVTVKNNQEVKAAIAKYPNAISYISFSSLDSDIKAINLDNIPASVLNISKGYFPLSREIRIYFNPGKLKESGKYRSFKKFVEFTYGSSGQNTISKLNLMPLTEAELHLVQIEAEPIYIGVAAPLEGAYTELGKSITYAAELAVEEANENLGINGKEIVLITCNDKANVATAIDCANKFLKAKVSGVIGHLTSQASIETSKIYAKHRITQISPASTHPWVTERPGARGYVFRTIGRDDSQAKLIAEKISSLEIKHPTKVAIFNNSTIYGSTLSTLIKNEIVKAGQDKVTKILALDSDQNQYHKEIAALESDILVYVGEYGSAAKIVKGLALNNKEHITFIGADGVFTQRYIDEAGLRAEGSFVTGNSLDGDPAKVEEFKDKFNEKFKADPSAFAMNSYDATMILIKAIEEAELNSNIKINEAVAETRYHGVTGLIYFNNRGDPVIPRMSIYKVQNSKFLREE